MGKRLRQSLIWLVVGYQSFVALHKHVCIILPVIVCRGSAPDLFCRHFCFAVLECSNIARLSQQYNACFFPEQKKKKVRLQRLLISPRIKEEPYWSLDSQSSLFPCPSNPKALPCCWALLLLEYFIQVSNPPPNNLSCLSEKHVCVCLCASVCVGGL